MESCLMERVVHRLDEIEEGGKEKGESKLFR